mgnify:CR=1 FL=1
MKAMIYLKDGSVIQTEDLNSTLADRVMLTVIYASNNRVASGAKLMIPMSNISFIEIL